MKGIELLTFLTQEQKERIEQSEQNYKRFARIYMSIVSFDGDNIIVKIWQQENVSQKYLTAKELILRGQEVFASALPENVKLHFRPIPFNNDTLESVNAEYIANKMVQQNLQAKDLVRLLNIDKTTLSRTLSAESMTKSTKAMFYYLFKYLEVK